MLEGGAPMTEPGSTGAAKLARRSPWVRLGMLIALLSGAVLGACRDNLPTERAVAVNTRSHICSIDPGPINCLCLEGDTIQGDTLECVAPEPYTLQIGPDIDGDTGLLDPVILQHIIPGKAHIVANESKRNFRVRVQNGSTPVRGSPVTLTLGVVQYSGSHQHDDGARPTGSFADLVPGGAPVTVNVAVTNANGYAHFTYFPPEASGTYTINAAAPSASSVSTTVRVGYALQRLTTDRNIRLTGETVAHPNAHYVDTTMQRSLHALADSVHEYSGEKLGVNDESLQLGGLIDTALNWLPPHYTHRKGNEADIQTHRDTVPVADSIIKKIKILWPRIVMGGTFKSEGTHLHLVVPRIP
jgi:hypothetical protein